MPMVHIIKPKLIEFVCTANHGRSPVAELIAQNYLQSLGAAGAYQAISSGSLVDDINAGNVSPGYMKIIVEQALGRGDVYRQTDARLAETAVKEGNESALKHYYDQAVGHFEAAEHSWREDAIRHFGIEGKLKQGREQTIARPDAVAVLPMADRNTAQVQKIYETSGYRGKHQPIIESIAPFVTGKQDASVPDAFGKTKKDYFDIIEQLREYVPRSIDMIMD